LIGCSEPVAAVALANLRALLRAPETKLLVLTPLILLVMFGVGLFGNLRSIPDAVRPLLAIGGISMTLMCFVQLQCNQFGFDRNGFRVYVLVPGNRQFILAGKNLSTAPLALGMCLVTLMVLQWMHPQEISQLIASGLQAVLVFLLFCLVGNLVSIVAPSPLSAGSFKPKRIRLSTFLIQFAIIFVLPVIALPAVFAWGVELAIRVGFPDTIVPWYLLISAGQLAMVAWLYRRALPRQGQLLQKREKKILEVVTSAAE
jgi:hypothetical protein